MAITGSPAVIVREEDLSSFVIADGVTSGALACSNLEWGPAEFPTRVSSENNLLTFFGRPTELNYKDWFTAKNFLQYSNALYITRAINEHSLNATDTGVGVLVENKDKFVENFINIKGKGCKIVARYPGDLGNKLRVCILTHAGMAEIKRQIKDNKLKKSVENGKYVFRNPNGEAIKLNKIIEYFGDVALRTDEIAIIVILENQYGDEELKESGVYSTILNSTDIAGYGNHLFKYFNNNSNWIYLVENNFDFTISKDVAGNINLHDNDIDVVLGGGITPSMENELYLSKRIAFYTKNYDNPNAKDEEKGKWVTKYGNDIATKERLYPISVEDLFEKDSFGKFLYQDQINALTEELLNTNRSGLYSAWDLFANEESGYEINLLMQGGGDIEIGNYVIQLAESRKDCVACVSPMEYEVVNTKTPVSNIIGAGEGSANGGSGIRYLNSSYAFMDGNYKYQYDNYNDVYRWLPLNGDIAGIMAQIDSEENPWVSPGGKQIKNCIKLAFHPSKAERDVLYANNVNPVTNFRAEGNVLYGDWTRVNNTSFNFIGVRRLFLYIERAIKNFARTILWKQNDELTETIFIQTTEPFLYDVKGGRGIQDFKVLAGSRVTSQDEMDKGIFRAKILVKPVRSIRFIELVFTSVRSDMSFEEVV